MRNLEEFTWILGGIEGEKRVKIAAFGRKKKGEKEKNGGAEWGKKGGKEE